MAKTSPLMRDKERMAQILLKFDKGPCFQQLLVRLDAGHQPQRLHRHHKHLEIFSGTAEPPAVAWLSLGMKS